MPEPVEDSRLAPYALRTERSRGRRHDEPPHPFRTAFQRDRDRIVHSTAFRRLVGKTQVLVVRTDDHHRNRLTHTLEVTMIARTIARRLGLNEDLTEAIALSHDLGHPPFGHAGERALDECMRDLGGFEHNAHGLRLVETLEHRHPDFAGLNLSREVLEAMAHHSKRPSAPEVTEHRREGSPFLEAQVVDAADSLAYDSHDLDDALALGLVGFDDLNEVEFWQHALERAHRDHPRIGHEQLRPTVIRTLVDRQVEDLLDHTARLLSSLGIASPDAARAAPELLVRHGDEIERMKRGLEEFLHRRVYRHPRVESMASKGARLLRDLFEEYSRHPESMPPRYARRAQDEGGRAVCDYLAGMTDRFAQDEHLRLFQPFPNV